MRRVLLGDFGEIVGLGLQEAIAGRPVEVVGSASAPSTVVDGISSVLPDVVVLDLALPGSVELAAEISTAFPAIKVVLCSSDEPIMRIYPPFHYGESHVTELDLLALVDSVVT